MHDTVIPPHEFIGRADTLRPPPPSPWIDAPTHDGLWWVWRGRGMTLWEMRRFDGHWRAKEMGWDIDPTVPAPFPKGWKFAPAIPPESP